MIIVFIILYDRSRIVIYRTSSWSSRICPDFSAFRCVWHYDSSECQLHEYQVDEDDHYTNDNFVTLSSSSSDTKTKIHVYRNQYFNSYLHVWWLYQVFLTTMHLRLSLSFSNPWVVFFWKTKIYHSVFFQSIRVHTSKFKLLWSIQWTCNWLIIYFSNFFLKNSSKIFEY